MLVKLLHADYALMLIQPIECVFFASWLLLFSLSLQKTITIMTQREHILMVEWKCAYSAWTNLTNKMGSLLASWLLSFPLTLQCDSSLYWRFYSVFRKKVYILKSVSKFDFCFKLSKIWQKVLMDQDHSFLTFTKSILGCSAYEWTQAKYFYQIQLHNSKIKNRFGHSFPSFFLIFFF